MGITGFVTYTKTVALLLSIHASGAKFATTSSTTRKTDRTELAARPAYDCLASLNLAFT